MCGIFGLMGKSKVSAPEIAALQSTLQHRGPDCSGYLQRENVILIHTRLSVIDLSNSGNQPMTNEDGSLWLIFNGEIYNSPELRQRLLKRGHRFKSSSDSEALLHLYEEQGSDMLKGLRGMFAFAIYNQISNEIFAARDPFGIKPFFYGQFSGGFAFASELRALLNLHDFPREVDWEGLSLYLRLNYIPAPWTIWKWARRLEPGHFLSIRKGEIVKKEKYFELKNDPWEGSLEDAIEALDQTLTDSVRTHLVSDVPVGALLSGGLDSSLVTSLAQKNLRRAVQTFTITFPGFYTYDESRYAREVSQYLNTEHEEIPVSSQEAREAIVEMLNHLDEPFADSSLVPMAIISKIARGHVKVALSGDGGDELFAGYNKYQALWLAERLNPIRPIFRSAANLPIHENRGSLIGDKWRQFRKFSHIMAPDSFERYVRATRAKNEESVRNICSVSDANGSLTDDVLKVHWQRGREKGFEGGNLWLYADANFVLPYDMLHKVDTASMKYSLEVRVPLIDSHVMNLSFSLPYKWKLRNGRRKWILKKMAERYLPSSIINRQKRGFGVPIGEWLRDGLRETFEEILCLETEGKSSIWKHNALQQMFSEHLSRRRDRFWDLWNIFVFEWWQRKWTPNFT